MFEIEKLEREIAEKKARLEQLKSEEQVRLEGIVMPAHLFTPEEKIKKFDELNAHVTNVIDRIKKSGYMDEDHQPHTCSQHQTSIGTLDPAPEKIDGPSSSHGRAAGRHQRTLHLPA